MVKEFVTERLKLIDLYPDKARKVAKEYGLEEDEVELIKKAVTSIKVETDKNERAVVSFINTEDVDRDNEIIDPDGAILEYYNRVVPYGHDYRGLPMGKNMWIKKAKKNGKKGLLAKTIFLKRPAINEELYHMYTDDIAGTGPALNGWSIGFIPLKWEDIKEKGEPKEGEADTRPKRKYTKWELLEYSGVMIGSNRQALTEMVGKGLIKDDKLKKDIEDFIVEIEKATYECTCIKCGWKHTSDKHCNTYKCEKCGGTMRRSSRPGPGQESQTEEDDYGVEGVSIESKEAEEFHNKLITKPEETDDFIRIPVRDCKVTATITISAKEGITALYCGKIKKIRTYIFSKKAPYNWTMKKALAWVKEHGKELSLMPEVIPAQNIEDIEKWIQWTLDNKVEALMLSDGSAIVREDVEETKEEPKEEGIVKTEFTEEVEQQLAEMKQAIADLKEGRVLSGKNLKLVKDCKEQIDLVGELLDKLIVASEPPKEESILPLIEDSKGKENITDINSLTKDDMPIIVEEVLKGLKEGISGQHKEIQKIFDKKRGKVN